MVDVMTNAYNTEQKILSVVWLIGVLMFFIFMIALSGCQERALTPTADNTVVSLSTKGEIMSDKTITTLHELKIEPRYYDAIMVGQKQFEVRLNDRGYQCGDRVLLRKLWNDGIGYAGPQIEATIGYVHSGLGMKENYVCFQLLDIVETREAINV